MKLNETPRVELREHAQIFETTLAEVGLSHADVLDLATPGNLEPPPDSVLEALRDAAVQLVPDPSALRAREAIAERLSSSPERVLIGHGAADLLWTCGRALAHTGSVVLVVLPGSFELAAAARASGARIVQWRAVERTGHAVDLEQVMELVQLERPALLSLCAPVWPSGAPVAFEAVQRMAAKFPDTIFVVDQSELELSEQSDELLLAPPDNVLCVRSIGPTLGLRGLGVGYLWARPELCAHLDCRRPSLSANGVTQAVAACWPRETEYVAACRSRLLANRERLAGVLSELGLAVTPSVTGALLTRVTRASEVARELLVRFRIAVADCTAFGLPDHLRISGVSDADAPALRAALAETLGRRGVPDGREG